MRAESLVAVWRKLRWAVVALFALWFLFLFLALPNWLPRKIERFVREGCGGCAFSVEAVRVAFFLDWVELRGVKFASGDARFTKVAAEVERVRFYPRWLGLRRKEAMVALVHVHSPLVTVTEGDEHAPLTQAAEGEEAPAWVFGAEKILLHAGAFQYERRSGEKRALLRVRDISGDVSAWSSRPSAPPQVTVGEVTGVLEASGKFRLRVAAPLFIPQTQVDVDLKIEGQQLAELNPFFGPSEAIALKGALTYGRAVVEVRERALTAWVRTRYQGLGVEFGPSRERGVLDAALNNLGASIALDESVSAETADALRQTRGVTLKQKLRESIVGFIFRGMKDAALRVATGS